MKGLINKEGWLVIERAGKMKTQYCPFANVSGESWSACGDWCPHFGEPDDLRNGKTSLILGCGNAYLVFTDFTDERINPDAAEQAAKP